MLKYFIIITIYVSFSSLGFAAGKTEKEENCSWSCKLPYHICLEKSFDRADKEKIQQSCYNQNQEEDPRDCVFNNYRKLSKEKRYESLKNHCKSDKSKCLNECMSR